MKGKQTTNKSVNHPEKPAVSFIGLNAYSEEQASSFFGRDKEIETLSNLVKTSTLTLLFGKSGTGKTSLLNAGVFPNLRKDYNMPFRIRLEFQDNSPDIITQIKQVLKSEIDKYGFKVKTYPGDETLWEYFHREPLWKIITPVLVFDQFEEIFTLAAKSVNFKKEDLHAFIEELSSVIENSVPKKLKEKYVNNNEHIRFLHTGQTAKIIFSFREDFLPEFESFTAQIPSIKNSRFRLMPMNGQQAYEVITRTWGNAIHTSEANKIVYFLTDQENEKGGKSKTDSLHFESIIVEPSLLSQVCSFIDKERETEGVKQISAGFLRKYTKDKILRSLYNEVLLEGESLVLLPKNEKTIQSSNHIKEFIEDNLITDEGYRTRYITSKIDKAILPGMTLLTRKYYLREEGESVELTHDVIVSLVKGDREKRRKALALLEAKRKANRKAIFVIILAALFAFALWWFVTHKASERNDELIAENERLDKKNNDLKKDSAMLDSAIHANRKLLGGTGGTNGKGKFDSTDRNLPKILNGLNVDSIRQIIISLTDSLQVKENQIQENSKKQYAYKQKILGELRDNIVKRKELETEIEALKIKFGAEKKPITVINSGSDETVKKLLGELSKSNNKIKELEAALRAKQKEYNDLKTDYDNKIDSLQNTIAELQRELKRYTRYYDTNQKSSSKEQIFGYGHDYAEDKVKRKKKQ